MPFDLHYSDEALGQLKRLRRFDQVSILDQIETMLTVNPTLVSKAKIKLLPAPTQYRLRVGEFRVFYDVDGSVVRILQVLSKKETLEYLRGTP